MVLKKVKEVVDTEGSIEIEVITSVNCPSSIILTIDEKDFHVFCFTDKVNIKAVSSRTDNPSSTVLLPESVGCQIRGFIKTFSHKQFPVISNVATETKEATKRFDEEKEGDGFSSASAGLSKSKFSSSMHYEQALCSKQEICTCSDDDCSQQESSKMGCIKGDASDSTKRQGILRLYDDSSAISQGVGVETGETIHEVSISSKLSMEFQPLILKQSCSDGDLSQDVYPVKEEVEDFNLSEVNETFGVSESRNMQSWGRHVDCGLKQENDIRVQSIASDDFAPSKMKASTEDPSVPITDAPIDDSCDSILLDNVTPESTVEATELKMFDNDRNVGSDSGLKDLETSEIHPVHDELSMCQGIKLSRKDNDMICKDVSSDSSSPLANTAKSVRKGRKRKCSSQSKGNVCNLAHQGSHKDIACASKSKENSLNTAQKPKRSYVSKIGPYPRKCDFCKEMFENFREFEKHRRNPNFRTVSQYPKCDSCKHPDGLPLEFRSEAEFIVHNSVHHGPKTDESSVETIDSNTVTMISCPLCPEKYSGECLLTFHVKQHTNEHRYICCACGIHLSFWRKHTNCFVDPNSKYLCWTCNATFPTRAELCHHKEIHNLQCFYCKKDFLTPASRNQHLLTAHIHDAIRCDVCNKPMKDEAHLKNHSKRHKLGRQETPCPLCGEMVPKKRLKDHVRIQHDKNAYCCEKCPMTFKTAGSLKSHAFQHSTEKPYACDQCTKTFKSNKFLSRHLQSHDKTRVFICEECGHKSTSQSNLKMHSVVHNKEKIFTCCLCNKGFNYKVSLKGHMRSKHNEFL